MDSEPEKVAMAADIFIKAYLSKIDKKDPERTAVLLYFGEQEIDMIVEIIKEQLWDDLIAAVAKEGEKAQIPSDKKILEKIIQAAHSADIALFGRMLAEHPGLGVDAACQVAHAISTHRVDLEMDFYTAVDDLNPGEETGAGMMGTTSYNSACFYRYALLDRNQLVKNLGDGTSAEDVIADFLRASVMAIPTGKQNSFAAQNLPDFGLFIVRRNGAPLSLANAFAKPVSIFPGRDEDLIGRSVASLAETHARFKEVYGTLGIVSEALFHTVDPNRLNGLAECDHGSVEKAIEITIEAVRRVAAED